MAYTALTAAQTDADSPLNQTLFDLIRTNLAHIIDDTTDKIETDLVVTDSITALNVTEAKLAANAVSYGKLKLATTGAISLSTSVRNVSIGQAAAHCPSDGATYYACFYGATSGSYGMSPGKFLNTTGTGSLYFVYHSASPPHFPLRHLGIEEQWGRFIYLLRHRTTGEIISQWSSPDPLWNMSDLGPWRKGDPRYIAMHPHPWTACEILPEWEIVLVSTMQGSDVDAVDFCPFTMAADELEARSVGAPADLQAADAIDAHEMRKRARPVKVKRFIREQHRATLLGDRSGLDLEAAILQADKPLLLKGKPAKLGVPAFDDHVTIVTI